MFFLLPFFCFVGATPTLGDDAQGNGVPVEGILVTADRPSIAPLGRGTELSTGIPSARTVRDHQTKNGSYETRRYADANGLPTGSNRDVIVDQDGYVWLANSIGLTRIGGGKTVTFDQDDGLPSDSVQCLRYEDAKRLWVGTDNGLACVSGATRTVMVIPALAGKTVQHIGRLHDGRLAVSTDCGLFVWDEQKETAISYKLKPGAGESRCLCSCADRCRGFTWVSTDDGVGKFDGKEFTAMTIGDGFPNERVWSIFSDSNDGIWFGAESSIFYYHHSAFETIRIDGKTDQHFRSFYEDQSGLVWTSSCADDGTTSMLAYGNPSPDGLVHEVIAPVTRLAGDQFGGIWACSPRSVSYLDRDRPKINTAC
jgi:ligand-binding sensor domain-containing protein